MSHGDGGRARYVDPVSPRGKDERPNRGADTRMAMGVLTVVADRTSLPKCGPATVSTERGAHSSVPSVSLMNRNTIAISALRASPSTTAAKVIQSCLDLHRTRKRCSPCALRPQCTSAAFRCLVIHQHEPARQRARKLANTPEFAKAQRQRKKVEAPVRRNSRIRSDCAVYACDD